MLKKLIAIILLTFLAGLILAGESKSWQLSIDQVSGVIPRTKDLGSGLQRATHTLNELGVSLQGSLFIVEEVRTGLLASLSDYEVHLNYGRGDLTLDYEYATGSTKYKVPNSTYLGYSLATIWDLPNAWELEISLRADYGTVAESDIDYSSYLTSAVNYARKARGSWSALSSTIGAAYSFGKIGCLFGIETLSNIVKLTYFDYPLSPGTENSTSEKYGNSNLYAGIEYKIVERGSVEFKYYLPINNDWLQGYTLKMGYEF